jgi:hypothetical protein
VSSKSDRHSARSRKRCRFAVVAAKRSFGLTEEMPLRDGYRREQSQTAAARRTEDTKEALAAFREKRKPVFRGGEPRDRRRRPPVGTAGFDLDHRALCAR